MVVGHMTAVSSTEPRHTGGGGCGSCGREEIAARAHLSAGTVRNHLSAAAAKLGAPNRHAAVEAARRHGWI